MDISNLRFSLPMAEILKLGLFTVNLKEDLQQGCFEVSLSRNGRTFVIGDSLHVPNELIPVYFQVDVNGLPTGVNTKAISTLKAQLTAYCNDMISAYRNAVPDKTGLSRISDCNADVKMDMDTWFDDVDSATRTIISSGILPIIRERFDAILKQRVGCKGFSESELTISHNDEHNCIDVSVGELSFVLNYDDLTSVGMGHVFKENRYVVYRCIEYVYRERLETLTRPFGIAFISTIVLKGLLQIIDSIRLRIFERSRKDSRGMRFNYDEVENIGLSSRFDSDDVEILFDVLVPDGDVLRLHPNFAVSMSYHERESAPLVSRDSRLIGDSANLYWNWIYGLDSLETARMTLVQEIEQRARYDDVGFIGGLFDDICYDENDYKKL